MILEVSSNLKDSMTWSIYEIQFNRSATEKKLNFLKKKKRKRRFFWNLSSLYHIFHPLTAKKIQEGHVNSHLFQHMAKGINFPTSQDKAHRQAQTDSCLKVPAGG